MTDHATSWWKPLVRQGVTASAAVHALAAASLWGAGWWMGTEAWEPVVPYPSEHAVASVSIPPPGSAEPEAPPRAALQLAPRLQSPEIGPLEPAVASVPRGSEPGLLASDDPVARVSPSDQLGDEGAPVVDRPRAGTTDDRWQRGELTEIGVPSGAYSRASSGMEARLVPRALLNPAPVYPPDALARRLEGIVLLQVAVDASGGVADVKVVRGSGTASLDESALAAVRQWRFLPARNSNTPIRRVNIPIEFVIREP